MEKSINSANGEVEAMKNVFNYITELEKEVKELSKLKNLKNSSNIKMTVSAFNEVLVAYMDENDSLFNTKDITEQFKACVVKFCSEKAVFEVDGMTFKITCERTV